MEGEMLLMKANVMASFAAGLLVASGVCGAVYFLSPNEEVTVKEEEAVIEPETVEAPTETEMKDLLATAGYVIYTQEEWDEQLAKVKAEAEANKPKNDDGDEAKEKVVYKAILNVSSGMTSIDVGEALVQAKIIDNAMTFFKEVEKRGLENDLRPGTFELDSNMSLDDAIKTIFKK